MAYGSDFLTGGTASAQDSAYGAASNAVDNNAGSYWAPNIVPPSTAWWKYDLGVGITKVAAQITIDPLSAAGIRVKDWALEGSNNDSTWDPLATGQHTNSGASEAFQFSNSTAYRYYRVTLSTNWGGGGYAVEEFEMMEDAVSSSSSSSSRSSSSSSSSMSSSSSSSSSKSSSSSSSSSNSKSSSSSSSSSISSSSSSSSISSSSSSSSDAYDTYTKLLMHFDGADESQTFYDEYSHAMTANGHVKIDNAQSKFGGTSAYFDGTTDFISTPHSDDWNATTGDFTIDFWIRPSNISANPIFVGQSGAQNDTNWLTYCYSNGRVGVGRTGVNEITTAADIINTSGNWYHIAYVRIHSTSTTTIYVNGVCRASNTTEVWNDSSLSLCIGAYANGATCYGGYMDELRISKGIARYTGNTVGTTYFSPPETPYGGGSSSSSSSSSSFSSSSSSSSSTSLLSSSSSSSSVSSSSSSSSSSVSFSLSSSSISSSSSSSSISSSSSSSSISSSSSSSSRSSSSSFSSSSISSSSSSSVESFSSSSSSSSSISSSSSSSSSSISSSSSLSRSSSSSSSSISSSSSSSISSSSYSSSSLSSSSSSSLLSFSSSSRSSSSNNERPFNFYDR